MLSTAKNNYPVSESIGHLINLTHRKLQPLLEERVRKYGLSYGTWFFLRALWEEDGVSKAELAERVGASQPTTLAALRKLAEQGFVSIRNDRSDKRKFRVMLTAKGRALHPVLIPRVAEINGVLLKGLKTSEADQLRRMLKIIQVNAKADIAASNPTTLRAPRARKPKA
jgi:DNA-binding MarR family transcriptional regulator